MVIAVKPLQEEKAAPPIDFTELGIMMDVKIPATYFCFIQHF
jgi:hypothetical protein